MTELPVDGLKGRTIALTGAGGFLGRAVGRVLVASGAEVIALLRHGHDAAQLRAFGLRPVVAPLVPGPGLAAAMGGADTLVHLAYDVRAGAEDNLAAFEAIHAAATAAGIDHIVHASSVVVYDAWPASGHYDETSLIGQSPAHGYRAAKIAMEQRLMAGQLPATILQPTLIWGPGSDLWTVRPMRQMARGGLVLPQPCGHAPLIHIRDAARAFALAAALTDPGHKRLLISGPSNPSWADFYEGYARIVGKGLVREPLSQLKALTAGPERPPVSGPSLAAKLSRQLRGLLGSRRFDALLERVSGLSPPRVPLRPDGFGLALYAASPLIDIARAKAVLRFDPMVDLAEGLAELAKHFASKP